MRELWVRIVATLTGMLVIMLALVFARLQSPRVPFTAPAVAPAMPPPALVEAGRAVYAAQGCAMCHAIAGEGNPRYPLDGAGERRDAAGLRDWILATGAAEAELPARAAGQKQTYRALPDEQLGALVAYMQSLGTEGMN